MAKIVIVDDSPSETLKITGYLESANHEVHTAQDGESGIELITKEQPELVLMDVVMPGLNGFQATRQLAKSPATQDIPVIIVTTKDQKTDRVWGKRQGAKGYLVKPVQRAELLGAVDAVLAGEVLL